MKGVGGIKNFDGPSNNVVDDSSPKHIRTHTRNVQYRFDALPYRAGLVVRARSRSLPFLFYLFIFPLPPPTNRKWLLTIRRGEELKRKETMITEEREREREITQVIVGDIFMLFLVVLTVTE